MHLVNKLQATQFGCEYRTLCHEFHLFTDPQADSRAPNPIYKYETVWCEAGTCG